MAVTFAFLDLRVLVVFVVRGAVILRGILVPSVQHSFTYFCADFLH